MKPAARPAVVRTRIAASSAAELRKQAGVAQDCASVGALIQLTGVSGPAGVKVAAGMS